MSLKLDLKKNVLDVLKTNGIPPITDKTFNDGWAYFIKTQPSRLSTSSLETKMDCWGNLELSLSKYGVEPKYAKIIVTRLKKKYGENLTPNEVRALISYMTF